jgi:iron complex transport system substrate-binding protein
VSTGRVFVVLFLLALAAAGVRAAAGGGDDAGAAAGSVRGAKAAPAPHSTASAATGGSRIASTTTTNAAASATGVASTTTTTAAGAPITVRDGAGNAVTLAAPARRIVSLAPHATELLFAAGAGDRVVGVVATSDFPPAARALPTVGDARALDLERIVALKPDLVVGWPYTSPAQAATLATRGIALFVSDPPTPAAIADELERLGALAGTSDVAAPAARALRERWTKLEARPRTEPPVRVFYEIWDAPLFTLGGGHLVSQAIAACGGENVFAALTLPAPVVSVEAVLAAGPDVIVAGAAGGVRPAWLDDWKKWPALPAVARGALVTVDADLLHRAGPRFVTGAEALCAAMDAGRASASK